MGFSVPADFHKPESECHMVQFKSDSTDDMLFIAAAVYNPEKQLLHKKYDTVPKNEIDDQGDLSALITGLILCLENDIKYIYIEGDCTVIRREKGEILDKLFDEFSYVYFKDTITEPNELDTLLTSSRASLQVSSPP